MAKKRITAYFMHEAERDKGLATLTGDVEVTESFLLAEADDADIRELREKGLIVRELDEPRARQSLQPRGRVAIFSGPAFAEVGLEDPEPSPLDSTKPTYYTVALNGPLLQSWRDQLRSLGAEVVRALGDDRYTLRATPETISKVSELKFVRQTPRLYRNRDAGPAMAAPSAVAPLPPTTAAPKAQTYEVLVQRADEALKVVEWLEQQTGVIVLGHQRAKIRFQAAPDSVVPTRVRALPEVALLHPWVPPKLHNDRARALIGLDDSNPSPLPWSGNGELVGVADSGLDEQHADFAGRIRQSVALGRPGDASDLHGHGTHVAGSVAARGSYPGTAPDAELYFQSIMDGEGELGGLPWDLRDLFEPAFQAGVRIHNNSWGAATSSEYTVNSIEVDEYVYEHPDFLPVISAGNEGSANSPFNAPPGFVDWLSIGSPASCKNALTVGASRSDRTSGGYSGLTFRDAWPNDFPDSPIGDETISGDPESLAAFSSRGPCTDRRIKPDVVAPGTNIVSSRASTAPLRSFWGPVPNDREHAYMGGTSMATPITTGCVAITRQYYRDEHGRQASAALLKATVINGAQWLTGGDATADHARHPNFHQGFGRIDMRRSLPLPGDPRRLLFVDSWQDGSLQLSRTGERYRWEFDLAGGGELRLCLVWTDPPGRALQNNLNLFLETPTGVKAHGNEQLPLGITPVDTENNVEVIRLDNPAPGTYLIQVSADNLISELPQAFALVIVGEIPGVLRPR